jgi:nitrous oxidase accessory protein NosD
MRLADTYQGTSIRALRIAALASSLLVLLAPAASAAPIHVNCDAGGNLQNKINGAPGGSTILVKGTCDGPSSVTFKSLTIRGNLTATLDGHDNGTTFSVIADDKTVTLVELVVTNGNTMSQGGGIYVHAGSLKLVRTVVRVNEVHGSQYSYGGGISILGPGTLTLMSSRVTGNQGADRAGGRLRLRLRPATSPSPTATVSAGRAP